jgi:glycosyltransferase involved in cell wall biosynthesis
MTRVHSRKAGGGRITAKRTVGFDAHRTSSPGIPLLWQGPIFNFSGYGDEARAMILAMQQRGYPVTVRPWDAEGSAFLEQFAQCAPDQLRALHQATQQPLHLPFVSVVHTPAYAAMPVHGAGAQVVRTMFETDGLPDDWLPNLNAMDEVWVPGAFNAETFKNAGVTASIHVVPGGIDASVYRPGLRPLRIPGTRGTVFLSVFEWSFRKGWDVLLDAWAEAFSPGDDVSLVLRTRLARGSGIQAATLDDEIDRYLASRGTSRSDVAPIIVLERPLSFDELPRLYASADVFVSASRGEGWGRPMMEAMACRLPTVATGWSGNLEFMHDDNSVLIEAEVVPVDERNEIGFFMGQQWAEPSSAHLVEILRRLHAEPELRSRLGARARRDIEQKWQWKQVTESIRSRIDALAAGIGADAGAVARAATATMTRVRWEGDFYAHHSLAGVNRALTGRLAAAGFAVTPVSHEAPPFPSDTSAEMQRIAASRMSWEASPSPPDVVVRHRWPPDLSGLGSTPLVLIQPWEFGGIPEAWIPQIRRDVSEVWCPSSWVADCYVRSGIAESKVTVVPNGVDTVRFTPEGIRYPLSTPKGTRLLFVGGTIPRKGIDVLLRAYLRTFGPADDVCLVVKAFGAGHVYRGSAIDDQLRAIAEDETSASVELIDEELSDVEVASLYRSCDVLVHPYRGEGFGLPVAEAMASGLPVVVTNYGACLDFCDESNALLVPTTVQPMELGDMGPSPIGYWWAEPDEDALGAILRSVVDEPSVLSGLGAAGRSRIVAEFTWDAAAARAASRLRALLGGGRAH